MRELPEDSSTVVAFLSGDSGQYLLEGLKVLSAVVVSVVLSVDALWDWLVLPTFGALLAAVVLDYWTYRHNKRADENRRVREYRRALDAVRYDEIDDEIARVEAYLRLLDEYLTYDGGGVRFTYHVPADGALEQAFPYIPDGEGRAGRTFDPDQGIIGEGYTRGRELVFNCENVTDCVESLQDHFGYDFDDAQYHSSQRGKRSYFCYPIIDEASGDVAGIVYFESTTPGTFPQRDGDQLQLVEEHERDEDTRKIVATCETIASDLV